MDCCESKLYNDYVLYSIWYQSFLLEFNQNFTHQSRVKKETELTL